METKMRPVTLVVEVPDGLEQYTPVALAHMLADAMKQSGLRNGDVCWPVRFGGAEMLAPPAPPGEPSTMSCSLWRQCRKHPAFGVAGLTEARADCPRFVVGGMVNKRYSPSIGSPHDDGRPSCATVTGGWCVCAAYEPEDSVSSAPDAT
jgi:hypothetical protein